MIQYYGCLSREVFQGLLCSSKSLVINLQFDHILLECFAACIHLLYNKSSTHPNSFQFPLLDPYSWWRYEAILCAWWWSRDRILTLIIIIIQINQHKEKRTFPTLFSVLLAIYLLSIKFGFWFFEFWIWVLGCWMVIMYSLHDFYHL
jgi:hypothetical protein